MSDRTGYAEIAAHFRRLIHDGELRPGDPLPSVRQAAETFGVTTSTASRALKVLDSERLTRVDGQTRVVAQSRTVVTGADRIDRAARTGRNYAPGERSTGHRVMIRSCADPRAVEALDIEPHDEVVVRIRVFRQDGRPTTVGLSVIHPRALSSVPEVGEEGPLPRLWQEIYTERTGREIVRGQRTVHARQASQDELSALEVDAPPHVAVSVLVANVAFHDDEGPIEWWEDVYAPGTEMPIAERL